MYVGRVRAVTMHPVVVRVRLQKGAVQKGVEGGEDVWYRITTRFCVIIFNFFRTCRATTSFISILIHTRFTKLFTPDHTRRSTLFTCQLFASDALSTCIKTWITGAVETTVHLNFVVAHFARPLNFWVWVTVLCFCRAPQIATVVTAIVRTKSHLTFIHTATTHVILTMTTPKTIAVTTSVCQASRAENTST